MLLAVVSFVLGIGCVAYFRVPPPWIFCAGVFVFLALLRQFFSSRIIKNTFLPLIFFTAGVAWNAYHAGQWLKNTLNKPERNVPIVGVITELPVEYEQTTRFIVQTELFSGQRKIKRLQLNWQKPHPDLQAGDRWRLIVNLKPPHALANIGAFNRQRFFWLQNIHATGYVVSDSFQKLPSDRHWIASFRRFLQREINEAIPDHSLAAIVSALTIGNESELKETEWNVLQKTGTVHLIVISGLHIGFTAAVAYFLVSRLWRCFPWLLLRIPAQKIGAIAAVFSVIGYGLLSGFGIPAQRAVIMIIVLMIGRLFYHETSVWRRILLAVFVIVLIQPEAIFSAGFWLSFSAVSWIAYAGVEEAEILVWRRWLQTQWALYLGLMPLTLYFFHQFSFVSFFTNLPAILWVEWVIAPLCLFAAMTSAISVAVGKILFKISAFFLKPLWFFLQTLSSWPMASGHHFFSNVWILFCALLGAAWCAAPKSVPMRGLAVLGFLPLWWMSPPKPAPNAVWLNVLDVGQGLSMVVRTAHHLLIYDAGSKIPGGFDAGRDVVLPYLNTLNVKSADMLIISHSDNDHSGGAQTILSQWPVRRVLTSAPHLFAKYRAEQCEAGQQWEWDNIVFRILSPPKNPIYHGNNNSCVLQIGHQILLVGDIEKESEADLVARYGENLRSDVLVVPHHGSNTSSTVDFIKTVQPQYAVYSLGYFNRFHFPAPKVVARFEAIGAKQYLTAKNGGILIQMTPDQAVHLEVANPHRYFWQL